MMIKIMAFIYQTFIKIYSTVEKPLNEGTLELATLLFILFKDNMIFKRIKKSLVVIVHIKYYK